jgi:hypothetical protein
MTSDSSSREVEVEIADAGELELEGAREYVIKQRCEEILKARQQAIEALSKYHALRHEASGQSDIEELNTHVAGQVWQFAFECKRLLSQTETGKAVWEHEDLGHWSLGDPDVDAEIRRIDQYRVQGRAPTMQTPTIHLVGVREFVDLAPPVSVEVIGEVLPSGVHAPTPEKRTLTYQETPPRRILVNVFDAVDGVVSELGLAPEVQPAEDDAKVDYEEIL